MLNRQTKPNVNLSFQDRYIMAFESELMAFNSHLILETTGVVDGEKIKNTFKKLIALEPLTRLVPNLEKGNFSLISYESLDLDHQIFSISDTSVLENFWDKKFDFEVNQEIPVRLALVSTDQTITKIIFCFHHSLYDGHAQFNFLKDFLDIYLEKNYIPRSLQDIYQFRKYFSKTSPLWITKLFFNTFKSQKKKVKIARLFDREPKNRSVEIELIELDRKIMDAAAKKLALSSSAYISLIGSRAIAQLLEERNVDAGQPIVLYITKSMRFELKVPRAYQNLLGFRWMKFSREQILKSDYAINFRNTYKFRSGESEVKKTLLIAAIIVKLKTFTNLKKLLAIKEAKVHDCTLLISSGRTPSEIEFPDEWKIIKLYAKGSMHRSPGIGLLVTSFKNKDFICIEYLKDAFNPETIARFKDLILMELDKSDP